MWVMGLLTAILKVPGVRGERGTCSELVSGDFGLAIGLAPWNSDWEPSGSEEGRRRRDEFGASLAEEYPEESILSPDSSLISVSAMRARSTRWPSSDSCDFDLLILDRSRSP